MYTATTTFLMQQCVRTVHSKDSNKISPTRIYRYSFLTYAFNTHHNWKCIINSLHLQRTHKMKGKKPIWWIIHVRIKIKRIPTDLNTSLQYKQPLALFAFSYDDFCGQISKLAVVVFRRTQERKVEVECINFASTSLSRTSSSSHIRFVFANSQYDIIDLNIKSFHPFEIDAFRASHALTFYQ